MTELELQSKLIRQQREGRDRIFVPYVPREGEKAEFRAEETLDGGGILLCRA